MARVCETCEHNGPGFFSVVCFSQCFGNSKWEAKKPRSVETPEQTADEDYPEACKGCRHRVKDLPAEPCNSCTDGQFFEPEPSNTQKLITDICDEVKNILLEKNRKYGDSAISPKRVFSKASPIEQINVRLDDKLSRILAAQDDDTEDAELDLIGYLILKRVAKKVLHDVQ